MVENAIQGIQKHWDALAAVKLVEKRRFSPKDGEEKAIKVFNDTMEMINGDVQNLVPAKDAKKSKVWNEAIDFYTALNTAPTEVPADEEPAEEPGEEPNQEQPGEEDPGEEGEPADESATEEEQEQTMATTKNGKSKATAKGKAAAKPAPKAPAKTAAKKPTEATGKRGRPRSWDESTKFKMGNRGNMAQKGFLKDYVDSVEKRQSFTLKDLLEKFKGKQDAERLTRYFTWCIAKGIFKPVA